MLSEGTDGHSHVSRWDYGLKVKGPRGSSWCSLNRGNLQTRHLHKKFGFARTSVRQRISSFSHFSFSFVSKELTKETKLQRFDLRERAQAHDTVAVLCENIHLVAGGIIAVLGLVLWCRCVVSIHPSWVSEMVISVPLFLSFFSYFILSPSFPWQLCLLGLQTV